MPIFIIIFAVGLIVLVASLLQKHNFPLDTGFSSNQLENIASAILFLGLLYAGVGVLIVNGWTDTIQGTQAILKFFWYCYIWPGWPIRYMLYFLPITLVFMSFRGGGGFMGALNEYYAGKAIEETRNFEFYFQIACLGGIVETMFWIAWFFKKAISND